MSTSTKVNNCILSYPVSVLEWLTKLVLYSMFVLKWLFESPGWLVVKLVRQKVRCTSVCVFLFMSLVSPEITLVIVADVGFCEIE